jgi:hypothetical protein
VTYLFGLLSLHFSLLCGRRRSRLSCLRPRVRRSSIAAISLVKTTGGFLVGLLVFCASPLKEKGPFWYNGYVYGTRAYSLYAEGNIDAA